MRRVLKTVLASAVVLSLTLGGPVSVSAGIFCNHGLFGCRACNSCRSCQVNPCRCQTTRAIPVQTQFTPQVQTTPVVTYCDVARTEYRLQAQRVTVPVTVQQTVTVDEGGWQKIWVPKLVSKQVPTTAYQQQIVYRQVPYQVTQRVPQVSYQTTTRMVPQYTRSVVSGCNTCGTGNVWTSRGHAHAGVIGSSPVALGPILGLPVTPNLTIPNRVIGPVTVPMKRSTGPVQLGRDLEPLTSVKPSPALGPVPDPAYLETPLAAETNEWTPVVAAIPKESAAAKPAAPRVSSATGMFVPAPSAASVWRTRFR